MKKIFLYIITIGTIAYILVLTGVAETKWGVWENDCWFPVKGYKIGNIILLKFSGRPTMCA